MSDTPMMQQYLSIRRGLPADTLLLFRLGDFYELFMEDAVRAAELLNVALTKRNGMPMCGVPYHAAEGYVAKLIAAGHRVAICDQVGAVQPGKIVGRQVTEIVSPGTVSDAAWLDAGRNNFFAAVAAHKGTWGLALVDVSTGDLRVTEVGTPAALADEIARFSPSELIVPEGNGDLSWPNATPYDAYAFERRHAEDLLQDHFKVHSLDAFGCGNLPAAVGAAGAALHYLKHQLRRPLDHVRTMGVFLSDDHVALDRATQAHLEIVQARGAGDDTSLLKALNRTVTPMGARLLRLWLLKPLRDLRVIRCRQDVIERGLEQPYLLGACRDALRGVRDVERTLGRLSQGGGNARDLRALRVSLEALPPLLAHLRELAGAEVIVEPDALAPRLAREISPLPDLCERLADALVEEPPASVREGGMFREKHHAGLDELRAAAAHGKAWVASLQQREIERTGIRSLKVRYTSVFGYFIEITRANLGAIPADYVRKQTTVNGERYVTPELKEVEGKILGAEERAQALEHELFVALREAVLERLEPLQRTAAALAQLDALLSLAETARLYGYCRPRVHDGDRIFIEEGRHPVLDQNVTAEKFVPNDCCLDGDEHRLVLLTGPNMAGKSTFIRQVALLVLMAQVGSFVPARSAEVGLVDRIFTRVGASDDLSRGLSTFMVEMNETANIIHNATARSLVVLDEIGRGTSTFDGLSIAWSVAEHLHDALRTRTLFATHYHEMTELEATCPGVKNYNVAVREWNDQIVFLRKIQRGPADKSYGIQVARLAGLPPVVLNRAKEILANLEASELNAQGRPRLAEARVFKSRARRTDAAKPQLNLFDYRPGGKDERRL